MANLRAKPPRPTSRGSRRRQGTRVSNSVSTTGATKLDAGGTGANAFTPLDLIRCNAAGDALESSGVAVSGLTPASATYLTLSTNAVLTNERVLTEGTGIDFVDGGAGSTLTISIDSTVATLDGIQTLTNKTLTTPTIASFTNAQHNHADAAGGGTIDHGGLTGNGDDDHALYLLASDATSRVAFAAAWIDLTDGNGTTLHTHAHNATTSLQGGTAGEYYHLTSAEYTGTGSGVFVRTSGATLVTPTIASFTNATHNHQNAAGGGTLANAALTNSTIGIVGTTNQIIVSSSPVALGGSTTLSLPQSIHTDADVTFDTVNLAPGTLGTGEQGLYLLATQNSTAGLGSAATVWFDVTSAGSDAGDRRTLLVQLRAGYTGSSRTAALEFSNSVAGTGADAVGFTANVGCGGSSTATTAGSNVGVWGSAEGGNENIGVLGRAIGTKASVPNVGVYGTAVNAGAGGVQIGGSFSLYGADGVWTTSCALLADNAGTTSAILVCLDNGVDAFSVADGGNVSGTALATQAQQETGTATDRIVVTGRQQFHPSAAKCWGVFDGTAGTPSFSASYNMTSITKDGTGLYTVTIATDFSSANYAILCQSTVGTVKVASVAAGSFQIRLSNAGDTVNVDSAYVSFACFGDQ